MTCDRKLRWIVLILATLAVSSCAQVEIQSLASRCDFSADPRFEQLRGKVPLSSRQATTAPSLGEISNENRPTPEERTLLLQYSDVMHPCRQQALEIVDRYGAPEVGGAFREYALAQLNMDKLLVQGNLSYGQARTAKYQLQARWQQVIGQYERARQISNAAQQQAAAAQVMAASQAFSAFNRQPTVTNCTALGPSVSCVSQ